MMRRAGWMTIVLLMATGSAWAETGKAMIRGTAEGSTISGTADFTTTASGLAIAIKIAGAPPGLHGLHIHQFGACEDQGKAAGGHFNPDGVKHGLLIKDGFAGAHAGDLGNITVNQDGIGLLKVTIPNMALSGQKYGVGGRAVVLHEKPDDFGQPTGNAGARIGCGPIIITGD